MRAMRVRRRVWLALVVLAGALTAVSLSRADEHETAEDIRDELERRRRRIQNFDAWITRNEQKVHEVTENGAFLFMLVAKDPGEDEEGVTHDEEQEDVAFDYAVVSKEKMVDLIMERIIFDSDMAEELTERELSHAIALKIRLFRRATRWTVKRLQTSLAQHRRATQEERQRVRVLERRLAELEAAADPTADPPATDSASGGAVLTQSTSITVTYREVADGTEGELNISFKLREDGQVDVTFGGAEPVTLPNGSTFNFQAEQYAARYARHYEIQMVLGRTPDGRLTARGQYRYHIPTSAVAERRQPRTRLFWSGVGEAPEGWAEGE